MKVKLLLLLSIIILSSGYSLHAQNELRGSVHSKNDNKPLPGVSVYFPDLKTGAISGSDGGYVIKNITSGTYLVEASLIGYRSHAENIVVKGAVAYNFDMATSAYELDEVLVTGVSSATQSRKNPVSSATLSQTSLLQNAATNIIDAINILPGVSQITVGPAISKPVIRGLGYNRVLVINDGIRQEGQQWFDEFGIEADDNSVNRVEVLKGPASLSYGSDAIAGVINFLPPPSLPEGSVKANILANYQTNNGLYNNAISLAGNTKGFTWDLLYNNKMAHDYKNKYDGYVWNSAYGENDLKGIFGINKSWGFSRVIVSMFNLNLGIVEGARDSATGKFTAHYLAFNGEDSLVLADENKYKAYKFYPVIHQHVRHYKVVWDNSFRAGAGRIIARLGLQENFRQEANDITKGDIYNNYFFLRTVNYDLQYLLPEKNMWQISFGVNGMQQSSEDRGILYMIPEYNLFDAGVFGIAKKTFNKLTFSGGLRFDDRRFHGKDLFVDADGVRQTTPDANSIHRFTDYHSDFSGFSGSAGVTYDFSKSVYGKFNAARGFRAPSAPESGSNGIHDGTPFYEIGDPNLKAENSLQFDATLGVISDDFDGEINAFRNQINNYIFPVKLESVIGGDSIRDDNVAGFEGPTFKYIAGDAVLSGGEIMVSIHPHTMGWLNIENAFSTVRAIQRNQGDSTKYLPYTPPDKIQSTLKISFKNINNVFKNTYFTFGVDNYFKQDKIYYKFGNETITPGYTLINAGLGTDICSKRATLFSIYLYGYNLSDKAYQNSMSRLKYCDTDNTTGRIGVYNMGRNFSIKVNIPINLK
ncbi:MAG: TonB-dependent receptor [Chitinophagaceae bacterium]|nr:TonB-dependent receptor [Chitinophagaceae bacterium]